MVVIVLGFLFMLGQPVGLSFDNLLRRIAGGIEIEQRLIEFEEFGAPRKVRFEQGPGGVRFATNVQGGGRRFGAGQLAGLSVIHRVGRHQKGQETMMTGRHLAPGDFVQPGPGTIDQTQAGSFENGRVGRAQGHRRSRTEHQTPKFAVERHALDLVPLRQARSRATFGIALIKVPQSQRQSGQWVHHLLLLVRVVDFGTKGLLIAQHDGVVGGP
mmetsp:Transcript_25151/g.69516  ORF Transcript_25151/g.69516 Transcript_25151/m.69516 type:complete len:214 (-) Transcript_25151:139-780(-)